MITCESSPITATPVPSDKAAVINGSSIASNDPNTMNNTTAGARKPNSNPVEELSWLPSASSVTFLGHAVLPSAAVTGDLSTNATRTEKRADHRIAARLRRRPTAPSSRLWQTRRATNVAMRSGMRTPFRVSPQRTNEIGVPPNMLVPDVMQDACVSRSRARSSSVARRQGSYGLVGSGARAGQMLVCWSLAPRSSASVALGGWSRRRP